MAEESYILIVFFLLQLSLLYFFSRLLTRAFAQIFYNLTRSHKATVSCLAVIFLPGTIIHELSHALMAGSLLARVGEIEFMPEIKEDGVKLGSAQIEKTDPLRGMIIGVAPVIVGLSLLLGIIYYLYYLYTNSSVSLALILIAGYFLFVISNTMFSSKKDLEGAFGVVAFFAAILTALYLLGFNSLFAWVSSLFTNQTVGYLKTANIYLLVVLLVDILIYIFARFILKKHIR